MSLTTNVKSDAELVADLFAQVINQSLSERLIDELSDSQITYPQVQVLRYLMLHNNVTIGDIARGLDISYPSATNMVHRLLKKELVRKEGNVRDRRLVGVALTDTGRELVIRMERERAKRFAAVLDRMDPVQRENLVVGLHGFVQAAITNNISEPNDICLRCGFLQDPHCPVVELQSLRICR